MAQSRRYKIGMHKTYDRTFDAAKGNSPVLNVAAVHPGIHSLNLSDANSLKSHLLERVGFQGDPKKMDIGYYVKGETGNLQIAHLKAAEEQIKSIKDEFSHLKQKKINEGQTPPKFMPKEMRDKMFRAEARYDIVQSEIETLERLLKNFTDADEKKSDNKVLQRGPQGSGKLRHGILIRVDGQTVEPDKDGILRIADERSRYNGMRTADYYEDIVKKWARANRKLQKAFYEKAHAGELEDTSARPPHAPWPELSNKKQEAA